MGCDIHAYIEYSTWNNEDGTPYYRNFGDEFGDRDYAMFGILAGVRRNGCLFEPRNLPSNLAFSTKWNAYLWISDNEETTDEHCVGKIQAHEWVKRGISIQIDEHHISHPDWHTYSWLTCDEFEQCVNARKDILDYGNIDDEWLAMLAAMKVLPKARLVFWFDN